MTTISRFLEGALTRYRQRHQPQVSPVELARWLAEGQLLQVLDIRSGEAFASGHLPGARSAPLATFDRAIQRLDPAAPTVVY